jgi:drug/metabolite transporter (DMT)-like permease
MRLFAVHSEPSSSPAEIVPLGSVSPSPLLPYWWMLSSAVAFSVMAAFAHALGDRVDWRVIATTRTFLAFVFASLLTVAAGKKLVVWRPRMLWVRSIAGSISLVCTFFALTRLPVADVLTLTNVFPIWVAILSWPLVGELPGLGACTAIAIALTGVVLVEQPHLSADRLPAILALVSSFSTAISMLGLHRLQGIDPRAVVAHFSGVALVVCLASLVLFPTFPATSSEIDSASAAMLLAVGISATIGQVFLTKAFAAGPPAKVSVVALTQVAFAMAFDIVVWHHAFSLVTIVGMALVIAPAAWLLVSQGRLQTDDL